jgi:hypothetical protein
MTCLEFFKDNSEKIKYNCVTLFNQIYVDGKIPEQQKHAVILCVPKTNGTIAPADCRPITLLNSNYNIMARMMASDPDQYS